MLEKAFKGSIRYWTLVGVLLTIMAIGAVCYYIQFTQGLSVTGLSRDVSWGLYIGQFTFMVGVAASAVMVVLPYYLHDYKAFAKLVILGECLAIPAVMMCMIFVAVDMGQPIRVTNVFLYPTPTSVMFWDIVSLSGYLVINVVIAWVTFTAEYRGIAPPKWIKPIIILSIPWAVSIHTVTAMLYCGLSARPLWMSAVLAPRFLASAFSAGPSLLIILCLIVRTYTKFDPGTKAIQKLGTIVAYAMAINVFLFGMELFTALAPGMPHHTEQILYMFSFSGLHGSGSSVAPVMWISAILGLGAMTALFFPKLRANHTYLAMMAGAVFVSLWLEKGFVMLVTGYNPSPLHAINNYVPSLVEIGIAASIWAFGFLVLTVLFKTVIAVREQKEQV
ncbi:MAG: polysulfide reductase NrfD [Proteobacteria bacterium]|jgi:Ni/Fe-hydrogenase subunit HybB-like protein|nr:polysulfide reductase NrfD [Pseudomonadota bacterium]